MVCEVLAWLAINGVIVNDKNMMSVKVKSEILNGVLVNLKVFCVK
jgi:hypothetical protein